MDLRLQHMKNNKTCFSRFASFLFVCQRDFWKFIDKFAHFRQRVRFEFRCDEDVQFCDFSSLLNTAKLGRCISSYVNFCLVVFCFFLCRHTQTYAQLPLKIRLRTEYYRSNSFVLHSDLQLLTCVCRWTNCNLHRLLSAELWSTTRRRDGTHGTLITRCSAIAERPRCRVH